MYLSAVIFIVATLVVWAESHRSDPWPGPPIDRSHSQHGVAHIRSPLPESLKFLPLGAMRVHYRDRQPCASQHLHMQYRQQPCSRMKHKCQTITFLSDRSGYPVVRVMSCQQRLGVSVVMAFGNERIHKTVSRCSMMVRHRELLVGVVSDLLIHSCGRIVFAPTIESQQGC
jgi:hypothetical protein